jgi:hypothetical protein
MSNVVIPVSRKTVPLGAVFCLLLPALGYGDEADPIHPYLGNKFFASVGVFSSDQKVRLGLDGSLELPEGGLTPYIDFSQSLGISTSDQTFSAEVGWRFGRKWQLRGQYFRVDDNSRATLEEDVEWGDAIYGVGTNVGVGTDMQITRLFFGRTFRATTSSEFGLGLGMHILDLSAYINGDATINGEDAGFVEERVSVSQPLPNFGAWYMHAFSPNWAATLRFDWLSANVDDLDGRIINAAASVGYAIGDHVGLSLAYNYFELAVDVDDNDWHGRARLRFNGPYLSLTGYW